MLAARVPNPMGFYINENNIYEISFLLVYKSFMCIQELTRYEAMNLVSSVLSVSFLFYQYRECITTVTGGHFVLRDIFLYHLNWTHIRSKMVFSIS